MLSRAPTDATSCASCVRAPCGGEALLRRLLRPLVVLELWSVLSMLGCAPAVVQRALPSPVVTRQEEQIDPKLLEAVRGEADGDAYRVGPGDTLLVAVYGHPELSISTYTTTGISSGRPVGLLIDNDGSIQFPLIGSVKVAGKTREE